MRLPRFFEGSRDEHALLPPNYRPAIADADPVAPLWSMTPARGIRTMSQL
jgi:hypothetical protein